MRKFICVLLVCGAFFAAGCQLAQEKEDAVKVSSAPLDEPDWLRNGEPVEFEGELWYPTDEVERLFDPEVYQIAETHGVRVFIDRADVKPYERLYTRYAKNRYRAFEKRP